MSQSHSHTSLRRQLGDLGERRRSAVETVSDTSRELAGLARDAIAAGVSVSEIARLAGVTRQTVYALTRAGRKVGCCERGGEMT